MTRQEKPRLQFGPYYTPPVRLGRKVFCNARGWMTVCALSDAPITWPIGKKGRGSRSLVLYRGLARAVRSESALAIRRWWKVGASTVTSWRKALGVDECTPGTRRLKAQRSKEAYDDGVGAALVASLASPVRAARIAAARRGKPRPPHVIAAMRAGRLGKPHSAKARRKMSEAHKRRGTRPPAAGKAWSPKEDEAVRTLPIGDAVARTGRTRHAVHCRRRVLKLPDGRRRHVRVR